MEVEEKYTDKNERSTTMTKKAKWKLTKQEQKAYIAAFTEELATLRAKVDISQDELSHMIGISRQTLSAIESGKRPMSWPTYLALLVFFDYHQATHKMLRNLPAFPNELIDRINGGGMASLESSAVLNGEQGKEAARMVQTLDEQGVHAVKTVLMIEYARCTNRTGDDVVRAFNGIDYSGFPTLAERRAADALKRIKSKD